MMIGQIYHVGLTVSNMDASIAFYRDVLGLHFEGEIFMEGLATERMFRKEGCKARVAYLKGDSDIKTPPVELIQFVSDDVARHGSELFETSISEVCFYVEDADKVYEHLQLHGVDCLSAPQEFDFTKDGFGKSKAFYFKDPDGIILEVMQPLL